MRNTSEINIPFITAAEEAAPQTGGAENCSPTPASWINNFFHRATLDLDIGWKGFTNDSNSCVFDNSFSLIGDVRLRYSSKAVIGHNLPSCFRGR